MQFDLSMLRASPAPSFRLRSQHRSRRNPQRIRIRFLAIPKFGFGDVDASALRADHDLAPGRFDHFADLAFDRAEGDDFFEARLVHPQLDAVEGGPGPRRQN